MKQAKFIFKHNPRNPVFSFDINGELIFPEYLTDHEKTAIRKWVKAAKIKPPITKQINTQGFDEAIPAE